MESVQEKALKNEPNTKDYFVEVRNLKTQFFTSKGIVKALDGVTLGIRRGEIFGLVGESGCGKSVTASSIMDLIPDPPGKIMAGSVFIDGFNILSDLRKLSKVTIKSETNVKIKRNKRLIKRHNFILSQIRGKTVSMIFQEPSLSLNPVLSVGSQIEEAVLLHSRIEIANAILRRSQISEEDIKKFLESSSTISDPYKKRGAVRVWCRNYGVAELDERIYEAVLSNNDTTVISKEILSLINESNQKVDLVAIGQARDYYKYEEDLFKLNRDLLQAESENNREKVDTVQAKIQDLKKSVGSEFFSYKFLRRFLKRKYERPFQLAARNRAIEMLEMVNIPEPERTLDSFPHELSGGMQQRAMIAMSLATNPKMLIADEPTTALDVTTQAQILDLIKDLKNVTGSSILFITHDLAVIAEMCDRVGVMYGGNLVEEASVNDIFFNPKHPYTTGLLSSITREFGKERRNMKLSTIPGSVPNLITPPSGCRFHPRCKFAMDVCKEKKPKLVELEAGHKVACFLYSSEVEENA